MIAPMVSVLVPCYGDGAPARAIASSPAREPELELEVLLLNNDAKQGEGVRRLVGSCGDQRIRLVDSGDAAGVRERRSTPESHRRAASSCFFANSDLFVAEDYLRELQHFSARIHVAGFATGKILRYDLCSRLRDIRPRHDGDRHEP